MDTHHLKSFLRIAELHSINRAAESLGIAQPSLSQQLLRLEDEVGVKLFRRTTRGVTLTEAGRVFQEHARHLLAGLDKALEEVRHFDGVATGQVTVAMPHSISRLIGVALVEAVMRTAPQISLRLVEAFSNSIRSGLEAGTVELGILHEGGTLRHHSKRVLASEEMFLIGPAGLFGASHSEAPVISPHELDDYPLIMPSPQHGLRNFLDREAARLGFTYKVHHEIDAIGNIAALVGRGYGYSILPLPAVTDQLTDGIVSVARIGGGSISRTLCLVRNPAQVITHASIVVEDLTVKIVAGLIDDGKWSAVAEAGLR